MGNESRGAARRGLMAADADGVQPLRPETRGDVELTENHDAFWALLAKGSTLIAACEAPGWIEELGDNGVRQPAGQLRVLVPRKRPKRSGRYLALEERLRIADLRLAGTGVDAIAAEIGRSASTVSRELRRNGPGPGPHNKKYAPYDAQKRGEASGCSSSGTVFWRSSRRCWRICASH